MKVRILPIDSRHPQPGVIGRAAEVLRRGGIVALPTETVYGLAVDPRQPRALASLSRLKGRPADKPFPLLFSRPDRLREWLSEPLPALLEPLGGAFWPGPLTVIVRGVEGLPGPISGPGRSLAVRVTSGPVARALIDRFGGPITGTSANRSGSPESAEPGPIGDALGDGLDLLLDAGPSPGGPGSTIVDLTARPPRVVRPGPIDSGALGRVLAAAG